MATKSIVPRADGEGKIGTTAKRWGEGHYDALKVLTAKVTGIESFTIACSDETTLLTTGTAKATFRMPYAFTLTAVRASVNTAPTGSVLTVDINEGGSTILSTKLTIDASETGSDTAAAAATFFSNGQEAVATNDVLQVNINQVGSSTAGSGLVVTLGFRIP